LKATQKTLINPEEARLKALELQKQVRQKVKEKEKQAEREREKKRIQMGKEMTIARRKMEETQAKLHLENLQKTKKKEEAEKDRLRRLIEEDKKARFGADYQEKAQKKNVPEDFKKTFGQMYKIYRYTDKNTLLSCLKTVNKYLANILKNPSEAKFQSIKQTNKVFENRIKSVIGGTNLLKNVGFEDQGEFLVFKGEIDDIDIIYKLIDNEVYKMDSMM
jgi:hypothetical protein